MSASLLLPLALAAQPIETRKIELPPGPVEAASEAGEAFLEDFKARDVAAMGDHALAGITVFVRNPFPSGVGRPEAMALAAFLEEPEGTWTRLEAKLMMTSLKAGEKLARAWGIYHAYSGNLTEHCGSIALGLARTLDGWKVVNADLAMVPLNECPDPEAQP